VNVLGSAPSGLLTFKLAISMWRTAFGSPQQRSAMAASRPCAPEFRVSDRFTTIHRTVEKTVEFHGWYDASSESPPASRTQERDGREADGRQHRTALLRRSEGGAATC